MKTLIFTSLVSAAALCTPSDSQADVWVRGYYRSSGTYVWPHYRSSPDRSFYNNWSTYPNVNPSTGRIGTRRWPSYRSYTPSYRSYTPSYRIRSYRRW